jgi:hypothetical protein
VARLAIHAEKHVEDVFGKGSMVDVEYERVGLATTAKRMGSGKVSPDIIFHDRGNPAGNYLVVEVKRSCHGYPRAWRKPKGPEKGDFNKIWFFTHDLKGAQPSGMVSYRLGLCLELDGDGADLWWFWDGLTTSSQPDLEHQGHTSGGGPVGPKALYERWEPPAKRDEAQ